MTKLESVRGHELKECFKEVVKDLREVEKLLASEKLWLDTEIPADPMAFLLLCHAQWQTSQLYEACRMLERMSTAGVE